MASKASIRLYDISDKELEDQLRAVEGIENYSNTLAEVPVDKVVQDEIIEAKVLTIDEEQQVVRLDINAKAEAALLFSEFDNKELPNVGDVIEVLYRGDNRQTNVPEVSKKDADHQRAWSKIVGKYHPGDVLDGYVQKLVKGGLMVSIDGVEVFMPASQIDIRRVAEPNDFVETTIQAKVVKIDEERQNIVISRRLLLEEERLEKRAELLENLEEGQTRTGEVKNIADFGAFVDLGGIDGLLHVTDMSYGRIKHPRELLKIGDQIEVFVQSIDNDRNRVALSLKALSNDPWENIEERYPSASVHKGRIANIVPYGLFVEIEEGVEGLVHVTELSWTQKNPNPEAEYSKGDEIDVYVKAIDFDKKEMSLSVREVEGNPWQRLAEHYAPGTVIEATIKNLASYGAFVEIEEGIDGLLHNTDFHWTRKIQHPSEIVKKGDRLQCVVLNVDLDKQRISLGMKQLTKNPWEDYIPSTYHVGDMLSGEITKHIAAGCFVKLEDELEAFLHYSTLPQEWHENPQSHCLVNMKIEVRIVRIDCGEERIGLSFIHADFDENVEVRAKWEEAQAAKAAKKAARQAAKEAAAAESSEEAAAESSEEAVAESSEEAVAESSEEAVAESSEEAAAESSEEAVAESSEEAAAESSEEAAAESSEEAAAESSEEESASKEPLEEENPAKD
jgi:small subunit ribosomal protein S1